MNYCNWKDIVKKIVYKFPPHLGSLPEGCGWIIGPPKNPHLMLGWFSIGLEDRQKHYTPFWDVFGDNKILKEELEKACNWLKERQLVYDEGYIDFENSTRR